MSSSQQYTESMSVQSSSKNNNITSLLDEDFLREEQFIDNYIESSLKNGPKSRYHGNEKEASQIYVKAIKGVPKEEKKLQGFQKVTVSSGSNEVNHFSRSISHDPENGEESSSEEEESDDDEEVEEDVIVPVTDYEKERAKRWSFGKVFNDKKKKVEEPAIVPMQEWRYPNDKVPPNKLFDEITFQIPSQSETNSHQINGDQTDGNISITMAPRSPRDGYPDFDAQTNKSIKSSYLTPDGNFNEKNNRRVIKVLVNNTNSQDSRQDSFRPIQLSPSPSSSSERGGKHVQHIIKIQPRAVRRSSSGSSTEERSLSIQHHGERESVQQIKHIRKSSLPEGFDDSQFRRETDQQLQQQRNLQQRMSRRQRNESSQQHNIEYSKQHQHHQHKLIQHQQHLQRLQQQQQQQQKRKQQQQQQQQHVNGQSHVVLNGRIMRRHSFDNSSLVARKEDADDARRVKTQRERPQTRERRMSFEQERDKLEDEIHRLQEKESRKHSQQHQLQQYNQASQQQISYQQHQQVSQQVSQQFSQHQSYNERKHQSRQEEIFLNHPRQLISQSATSTPNLQKNRKQTDPFLTPDQGRKRGKIPNNLRSGFQSEDIINPQSKLGPRRKSNPNLILGRTDINKQRATDVSNHSQTLPRGFGRKSKTQLVRIIFKLFVIPIVFKHHDEYFIQFSESLTDSTQK